MEQQICPVDVISVCSADGKMRPLRIRLADENRQLFRINIDEVLDVQEICHVGAEASIFLCRARVWDRLWTFELKYSVRSHTWCILRSVE